MIDFLRQKIASQFGRDRPVARRSAILVVASAIGQVLLFLGTLVAAFHYDPAAFGVLGVFATFAVLFGMISTGRLEAAIPIPRRDHRARAIVAVTAAIVPATAIVSWIVMEAFGRTLLEWTDAAILDSLPWAVPAATLILGFRALAIMWATRSNLLGGLAIGRIANGGVLAAVFTASSILDPRIEWLVGAWISGQAAELIAVAMAVGMDPAFRERGLGHKRWRRALLRYRRFPTILLWSHLLEQLGGHLPTTLVSGGYGADIGGQFNLIQRIVARPVAIIGSSATVVLMSEASRALRAGEAIRPIIAVCLRKLVLLAALIFTPIAAVGPWAVPMILSDEWAASGMFLLALLPGVVADFIVIPVFPVLGLVERLWTQLAGSILRIGLMALAIVGGAEAGISATTMMLAVSGAAVVAGIFGLTMCWRVTSADRVRKDRDLRRTRRAPAS